MLDSDKPNRVSALVGGFVLIAVIGMLDYITGSELAFSVFYVLPIYLVTWMSSPRLGLVASAASALAWFLADITTTRPYASPLIPVWNTIIRLVFFFLINYLLSSLKHSLRLANTDHLTSAINSRHFHELLEMEIDRFQRYQHPFTVAYVDLDNFKNLNDQFGHLSGDEVLRILVSRTRRVIRKTDLVARVGGDEFMMLFPETDDESARTICAKINDGFQEEMQQRGWVVTMSVGVLTCHMLPHSADEVIRMADNLMYSAKAHGKNIIQSLTYKG